MSCDLTLDAVRPTVGQISTELLQKEPDTRNPIELMREGLTDYEKNVLECIQRGKTKLQSDFFVEVTTKKEPLMPNVLRNYFSHRYSCPTPNYDQTVYKYTLQNDHIELLWVIPARDICFNLIQNKLLVPPEEYPILENVLKFESGDLFKLCKQLNGEE